MGIIIKYHKIMLAGLILTSLGMAGLGIIDLIED